MSHSDWERLDWDVLWVLLVNPVLTKVWDLGVESLLEQWPVISEGGGSSGGSTTPENQVAGVSLDSSEVDTRLGDLVDWSLDVLGKLV